MKNICKVDKNVNILLSGLLQVEEKKYWPLTDVVLYIHVQTLKIGIKYC